MAETTKDLEEPCEKNILSHQSHAAGDGKRSPTIESDNPKNDELTGTTYCLKIPITPKYIYIICLIEIIFLLFCLALNLIHYITVFEQPYLVLQDMTGPILVVLVTCIQLGSGFIFEIILITAVCYKSRRLLNVHTYGEAAAIPVLLLNAMFVLAMCYGPFPEAKIFGRYKPGNLILVALVSIVMAVLEVVFLCVLHPIASVRKSSTILCIHGGSNKTAEDLERADKTVSSESFLVKKFPKKQQQKSLPPRKLHKLAESDDLKTEAEVSGEGEYENIDNIHTLSHDSGRGSTEFVHSSPLATGEDQQQLYSVPTKSSPDVNETVMAISQHKSILDGTSRTSSSEGKDELDETVIYDLPPEESLVRQPAAAGKKRLTTMEEPQYETMDGHPRAKVTFGGPQQKVEPKPEPPMAAVMTGIPQQKVQPMPEPPMAAVMTGIPQQKVDPMPEPPMAALKTGILKPQTQLQQDLRRGIEKPAAVGGNVNVVRVDENTEREVQTVKFSYDSENGLGLPKYWEEDKPDASSHENIVVAKKEKVVMNEYRRPTGGAASSGGSATALAISKFGNVFRKL